MSHPPAHDSFCLHQRHRVCNGMVLHGLLEYFPVNHTAHQRVEITALAAILIQAKGLAESLRFWISTGQVPADERRFASGQLREFDAAWNKYGELTTWEEQKYADKMSRATRKAS